MGAWLERVVGGAAFLSLLAFPARAAAAPTARLVYSRAADASSCPDEAALRQAVSQRVGYDVFFPWAPRTVVVAIVRRQGAFVATVSLIDEGGIDHGAHELHTGRACAELLDTVALAVAIATDPQSVLPTPQPGAVEAAAPPPDLPPVPSMPAPVDAIAPAHAPSLLTPPLRVRLEASLGATLSAGMAPAVAVGTTLGATLRWRSLSLGLEGAVEAPASKGVVSGGRVSSWLAYGALVPCVHLGPFFGCGLLQAGALESTASGVSPTRSSSNAWWALGGRVGAMVPLTAHWQLRVRLDVVGDPAPTTLQLNDSPAWQAPPVAGSLGIDGVFRF